MITVRVSATGREVAVTEELAAEFARMYPDKAADIAGEFPDQAPAIAEALDDRDYIPHVVGAVPAATTEILKRCPDACRNTVFLALLGSNAVTDASDIVVALEGVTLYDFEIEHIMAATPEDYGADIASELFKRKPTCWPTLIEHLSEDNAKAFVELHRAELNCAELALTFVTAIIYAMVYPDKAGEAAKQFPEQIEGIIDVIPPESAHLLVTAVPSCIGQVLDKSDEHRLDVMGVFFSSDDGSSAREMLQALNGYEPTDDEIQAIMEAAPADKRRIAADRLIGIYPESWPTLIEHLPKPAVQRFLHTHAGAIAKTATLFASPGLDPE